MREKAVSIIIPCYNVEKFLPCCVDSLLKQTIGLEDLELIFVDDASTDGTLRYLYDLEEKYPSEIVVIACSDNQGQSVARNIGLGHATGKYVGFVDADDYILPQMYEEMYQKAESTECELVDSYSCLVRAGNECARGRFQDESLDILIHIQNDEQRRKILIMGIGMLSTVCVWSKLYRRDLLEKYHLRFGEKYVFEDIYFLNMVLFFVKKICILQAEYYHYRVHPGSTMTTMDCKKWSEQRKIMQIWLEECIDRGLLENYYHEIELVFAKEYYLSILHYAFLNGGDDIDPIVEHSQMVMKNLFPNVEENPYIACNGEKYLRACQKELFTYVSKGFSPGEVEKARKEYLKKALELVKKEKAGQEKPSGQPKITVMLGTDKNYLRPAMVLIASLFWNHQGQEVTVYLLHQGCDSEDLEGIRLFADGWPDKEICCIEVPAERLASLKAFGRFSVAAFFRILGMSLIPEQVERILYLDVDMVVNKDLSALFSREMKKPLAACYDVNNYLQGNIGYHKKVLGIPTGYPYFNSGMLFMDLQYMREHEVAERLMTDIEEHFDAYSLVDQDALNKYFYADVDILPWQAYNCPCVPFLSRQAGDRKGDALITYPELYSQKGEFQIHDITGTLMENAHIIHFCTSQKPWRDRDFYEQENMRAAMRIYQEYERMYEHARSGKKI